MKIKSVYDHPKVFELQKRKVFFSSGCAQRDTTENPLKSSICRKKSAALICNL